MPNTRKLKASRKASLAAGLVLLLVLFSGIVTSVSATVSADPPNTQVTTQKYCKAHISGKAQAGCTIKNVDSIRKAVSDGCSGQNADDCTEKAAEGLIDKIAQQKPKTVADFNSSLSTVVKAAQANGNGGAGNGSSDNNGSTDDNAGSVQPGHCTSDNNCDLIRLYVNPFIRLLTIVVGLVVAASLVLAGVQYSASGGDPQKTSAAKSRVSNTLLALFAYAFMYAFLNFLIPGGIFP